MSLEIDDGQLDGRTPQECFLLGYEYATITTRIRLGYPFENLVNADNADRIEQFCRLVGARYLMSWNWGDSTEQWKHFTFEGLGETDVG